MTAAHGKWELGTKCALGHARNAHTFVVYLHICNTLLEKLGFSFNFQLLHVSRFVIFQARDIVAKVACACSGWEKEGEGKKIVNSTCRPRSSSILAYLFQLLASSLANYAQFTFHHQSFFLLFFYLSQLSVSLSLQLTTSALQTRARNFKPLVKEDAPRHFV